MNNIARSGNSMFHFRFAVVYTPMVESEQILHFGMIVAWYTVSGPSNNYLELLVLGNYRYISPQSPQMQYLCLKHTVS